MADYPMMYCARCIVQVSLLNPGRMLQEWGLERGYAIAAAAL